MLRIWKLLVFLHLRKSNSLLEDLKTVLTNVSGLRYISWLKLNHPETDFIIFSSELSLLDFFPKTTPLDAIAVCDDSSNTKVVEIEDSTLIITTPDEAITHRWEKDIRYLISRPIAVCLRWWKQSKQQRTDNTS